MIVMKFGGTSVGSRDRYARMAALVTATASPVTVVVSAMGGTTDQLLDAGRLAEGGDWEGAHGITEAIWRRHRDAVDEAAVLRIVEELIGELRSLLRGVYLLRETTPRSRALLVSFGERLSAPIAAAHIRAAGRKSVPEDARAFVRTDDQYDDAAVDMDATRDGAEAVLRPLLDDEIIPVVTGFIGSTEAGTTTTLGRGGSDYTAALLGGLMGAAEIWIWTDVDGILTADPRLVSEARTLRQVSFREAAEMSYFGAKVLHPRTMLPAMQAGVPIRIRSTFTPEAPGTVVAEESERLPQGVKTVTSIRHMALVTLDGRGMSGIPGVARRIFESTERARANVVMISQASSEQTVSLVVGLPVADRLIAALRETFALELHAGWIASIAARRDVAVLSIIGQGMAGTPGVSGKLFGALGNLGVNVLAIAQGASELSISVAVADSEVTRGVRAVHTAFGLTRTVNVVLIGCGRVGQSLLRMLDETRAATAARDIELRLVGIASSRRWVADHDGIALDTAAARLAASGDRPDDDALIAELLAEKFTDVIVVDVTAGPLAPLHLKALRAGFHVVTANKVPLSGPLDEYREMVAVRDSRGVRYEYETTFGAGLPVLHTLKELVHTGDTLLSVSGCFSGTLGFVCTRLGEGVGLAEAVQEAADLGYTEPDPREDLSGRDVARKALIVARAMGRRLEPDAVQLDALVPGLEAGLEVAVEAYAPVLAERIAAAAARDAVLRYVAEIDGDGVRVGLREVPAAGPIGSLTGPDNILVFRTGRYDAHPIVIRGPGAGAEVTAAGVLGDILRIAQAV